MDSNQITIIIPCYNEEKNIELLFEKIKDNLKNITDFEFNYLFIDDGSSDNTFQVIEKLANKYNNIQAIQLSRNFGSHIAISAGVENVKQSNSLIVISADLQEPPDIIIRLIKKWLEGYEVVWTIREKRSQSFIGKIFSNMFHKLFLKASNFNNYPKEGPSASFLLDKKVYLNWKKFRESNRMIFGMIAWMGFKHTYIKYLQNSRMSGKSSYTFFKLIKLAIDSFVSFSFAPIRIISYIGIIISILSFVYASFLIFEKFYFDVIITGWTSLMVIILILGGVQLITLGIIGEYVWRGVEESRNRPLYLISKKINFEEDTENK